MWGVIPAAGRGSRMEEHHVDGCKELIEVAGRSMLLRTLDELVAAGVSGIVVVTSPEKPALVEALADYDAADLEFVEQSEPRGIVDALGKARDVVGTGCWSPHRTTCSSAIPALPPNCWTHTD